TSSIRESYIQASLACAITGAAENSQPKKTAPSKQLLTHASRGKRFLPLKSNSNFLYNPFLYHKNEPNPKIKSNVILMLHR
ncbi:MAG: hypothetical protein IIT82_02905, partial [Selenomonas sp.]|nr:hypothetical protein [Selenomonas sp.]